MSWQPRDGDEGGTLTAPSRTSVPRGGRELARLGDVVFKNVCRAAAVAVLVVAALLVVFLVKESWPAMRTIGLRFFTHTNWDPTRHDYGALAFVWGTLATSALAMLVAVPLGVGAAAFLAEIAPGWLRRAGSFLIELLAAIPSVVYGFWGIFFLAPGVQRLFDLAGGPNTGGTGILSAGLILSIMVVPYIAAITFDVCRAVPRAQREGALALGSTRWQTIWSVVLPYARPGIVGGCFLALGRALGETMAVTMLIGNSAKIDLSPFAVGDSIASKVANQLGNTTDPLTVSALVELGLVLFCVTAAVNCLARVLIWRVGHVGKRFPRSEAPPGNARLRGSASREELPAEEPTAAREAEPRRRAFPGGASERGANARAWWVNQVMTAVLAGCLAVTLGPLFLILGYITYRGVTSLNLAFFTQLPIADPPGLGHALLGSALLVGLATLFAVPVAILAAIYLAEYRTGRLVPAVRFVGELLGGVPSIILGIFAYALLVNPALWPDLMARLGFAKFSGWAGALALGVMMIPVVTRASEEALKLVPQSIRNASYALGATHWQTVARVVVPAALPTIVTGVFLAVARVAGETAPLLMTAYNSTFWPSSPGERTPFLTYYIYNYSRSESPAEQEQAWAAALVLLAVVMLLNVGIRLLTGRRVVSADRAE